MKKIIIILISCLCLFGCDSNKYTEINYDEYKEKIDNKEDFILFIGSTDCFHCDDFKKTLNLVLKKYKAEVNYIDISKLSDDENASLSGKISYKGTPTTVFIIDGKEDSSYNRIIGAKSEEYTLDKIKGFYEQLEKIEEEKKKNK